MTETDIAFHPVTDTCGTTRAIAYRHTSGKGG